MHEVTAYNCKVISIDICQLPNILFTHSFINLFIHSENIFGCLLCTRILSSGIIIVNMTQSFFISSSFSNNIKYTYKHKKIISVKLISSVIIFFEFIHNLKFQDYRFRMWASIFTKIIFYHKSSLSDNSVWPLTNFDEKKKSTDIPEIYLNA